jgi:lipoate-protein ligase A
MQIPASLNERHDVVVNRFKICYSFDTNLAVTLIVLHVSGSAYKIVNKRAYHHGTMLLDSDLQSLGGALRPPNVSVCLFPILSG